MKTKRWRAAAKTWNGQWWKYGGGGTPWDGIAYDPELNLVYVGTGNGSPWNANHRSPGGGDNLYLSSIVALNADTGKYVWHYQTTPGDNWDYNAAQPMILADLTIGGQPRKVIMQAPKNGFFYVLDRTTGKLISGEPYVLHVVGDRDRQGDRPSDRNRGRALSLHAGAAVAVAGRRASLAADGVQPDDRLVYYPGQETSSAFAMEEKFEFKEGQWNLGITSRQPGAKPTPPPPPIRRRRSPAGSSWRGIRSRRRRRGRFRSSQAAVRCRRPAS